MSEIEGYPRCKAAKRHASKIHVSTGKKTCGIHESQINEEPHLKTGTTLNDKNTDSM
jgi:hypothetical protein